MWNANLRTCPESLWYWCKYSFAGKTRQKAVFGQGFKQWIGRRYTEEGTKGCLQAIFFIHLSFTSHHATKSGTWLLTTLKPILERQGWWKKILLYVRGQQLGRRVGRLMSKGWFPPLTISGQELLKGVSGVYRWWKGATYRNSIISSDNRLEVGHAVVWSSIILIVLSIVDLQFQGRFVPVSLRPVLRIVAAYVMATGEGNGNPLQYPCLENPMGGGAW